MNIKEWIIKKLEKDVEPKAGHIDLEKMNEEEREKCFIEFGEGDKNLTTFLTTAYNNGAPSLFCCSGHGKQSAYIVLKVTEDNIEVLRKVGKVLSKNGVATNFENNHIRGKVVSYRAIRSIETEWLNIATQVMENPELFDDSNPEIYYHEQFYSSYKPFGFDLKKKILSYLRGDRKELPSGSEERNIGQEKSTKLFREEQKNRLKQGKESETKKIQNVISNDNNEIER